MQSIFLATDQGQSAQGYKFRVGIGEAIATIDPWPDAREIYVPSNYGTFFKVLYLTYTKTNPFDNLQGKTPIVISTIPPSDYYVVNGWWITQEDKGSTVGNWGRQILILNSYGLPLWSVYASRQATPEKQFIMGNIDLSIEEIFYFWVMSFGISWITIWKVAEESLREGHYLAGGDNASDSYASSWKY